MQKKLTDLEGELYDHMKVGRPTSLWFICPLCPSGHSIAVAFEGASYSTGGEIWKKTGSTLEDISVTPSINCDCDIDVKQPDGTTKKVRSSCKFHGFVTNGQVIY
jgi:hypothetical protein